VCHCGCLVCELCSLNTLSGPLYSAQAVKVVVGYGWTKEEQDALKAELRKYHAWEYPYNSVPVEEETQFCVIRWWRLVKTVAPSTRPLVLVAIVICSIQPHAAEIERVFSLMGWFHSDYRNRMILDNLAGMTKVKIYYEQQLEKGGG
jgi:hypothetical protein